MVDELDAIMVNEHDPCRLRELVIVKLGSCSSPLKALNSTLNDSIQKGAELTL